MEELLKKSSSIMYIGLKFMDHGLISRPNKSHPMMAVVLVKGPPNISF